MIEKIQYQDDYLSEENIAKNINSIWAKALPIFQHRKFLYNRYTRKNDTSDVVIALEYYISTIASGYFGGKEPQYKVKTPNDTQKNVLQKIFTKIFGDKNNPDEFQSIVDYITAYNDNSSFFYDCVKDYINMGACYGLIYENTDNEIVYANTSALTTVAIWNYDTPATKIGLLRYWYENSSKGGIETHLELITNTYKKHYIDGIEKTSITPSSKFDFKEVTADSQDVLWDDLPCFAVENPDGMGFFENVITLINKYEQVVSNNANIFQYNDDAKLAISGYAPENESTITQTETINGIEQQVIVANPARQLEDKLVLESRTIYFPDATGKAEWIIKNINDTASENHKKTCLDMALMIVGVPNVTDQGFSNADNASALEKKFFPLEQVMQQADHIFKKELLRMWEMIVSRINLKKNMDFDFRDIEIILTRNLPTDTDTIVTTWLKLRGLLSDKTVIDHLPFDLDSQSELAEVDKQNQENIQNNLENMSKMGQDTSNATLNTQQDNNSKPDNINQKNVKLDNTKKDNIKQSTIISKNDTK